jgi:thiol-disulfide isomerase/thioredoxin
MSRGSGARRLVGLLAAGLLLGGCVSAGPAQTAATAPMAASASDAPGTTIFPVSQRRPAPALTGSTLDGHRLALAALTGSGVVVLNVWASWCTSCKEEAAAIAAVAADQRAVRFLGIDELDPPAKARTFLASVGTTYPQLADPEGNVLRALTLLPQSAIPSTLLLDSRGRMAARVIGPVTEKELRRLILAAGAAG